MKYTQNVKRDKKHINVYSNEQQAAAVATHSSHSVGNIRVAQSKNI